MDEDQQKLNTEDGEVLSHRLVEMLQEDSGKLLNFLSPHCWRRWEWSRPQGRLHPDKVDLIQYSYVNAQTHPGEVFCSPFKLNIHEFGSSYADHFILSE